MSRFALTLALCATVALTLAAQTTPKTRSTPEQMRAAGYLQVEAGPNSRTWHRAGWRTNEAGVLVWHTNKVVELSSGLNKRDVTGRWIEAVPVLSRDQNGNILGQGAAHEARFSHNLNTSGNQASVHIRLPDGGRIKAKIIGLAYEDSVSGTNVLIAEVKDSSPRIDTTNSLVVYPDAFAGLKCNVNYSYTKSGLIQDVILKQRPPPPESYGISASNAHLLVLTEMLEAPTPKIKTQWWKSGRETMQNQTADFNSMHLALGHGFSQGRSGFERQGGVAVAKQMGAADGRQWLVERVRYGAVAGELRKLPAASGTATNASANKVSRWFARGTLPPVETRQAAMVCVATAVMVPTYFLVRPVVLPST